MLTNKEVDNNAEEDVVQKVVRKKFNIRRQSKFRMNKSRKTLQYYAKCYEANPNYVPRKGINFSEDRTKILPGPIRKNKKVKPKLGTQKNRKVKEVTSTSIGPIATSNLMDYDSGDSQPIVDDMMEMEQFSLATAQHDDLRLNEDKMNVQENRKGDKEEEIQLCDIGLDLHDNHKRDYIKFDILEEGISACNNSDRDPLIGGTTMQSLNEDITLTIFTNEDPKKIEPTSIQTSSNKRNAMCHTLPASQTPDSDLMDKQQILRPTSPQAYLLLNEGKYEEHENEKSAAEDEIHGSDTKFFHDNNSMDSNENSEKLRSLNDKRGHTIFDVMEEKKADCNIMRKDTVAENKEINHAGVEHGLTAELQKERSILISPKAAQLFLHSNSKDSVVRDQDDDDEPVDAAIVHFADSYSESVSNFQYLLYENDINDSFVEDL